MHTFFHRSGLDPNTWPCCFQRIYRWVMLLHRSSSCYGLGRERERRPAVLSPSFWCSCTFRRTWSSVGLGCVALRCVALRCVALRCVALRCVALRCVAIVCYHDTFTQRQKYIGILFRFSKYVNMKLKYWPDVGSRNRPNNENESYSCYCILTYMVN